MACPVKKRHMKKQHIILLAAIAILAFGIAFPFLRAAYRMKVYLRAVDSHFAQYVKPFACYDPVGGAFIMRITDRSGDSILLECVSDGRIIDEERTSRYLEEHSIHTHYRADDNSVGYLRCYWNYDSPEEPVFSLRILLGNYIPATDEVRLEKALKALLQTHYDLLPDVVKDHPLTCRVGRRTANTSYRLIVSTTAGDDFAALLKQTKLIKEETEERT